MNPIKNNKLHFATILCSGLIITLALIACGEPSKVDSESKANSQTGVLTKNQQGGLDAANKMQAQMQQTADRREQQSRDEGI
jgi:hypothetical protein